MLERVAECICADMGSSGLDILRHVCWGSMGNSDKLMVALSRRVDAGTSGSCVERAGRGFRAPATPPPC